MSKAHEAVTQENDARFTLHAPDAESVYLAGTFNDWKPDATPMVRDKNGTWHAHVQD
jgi:1,4-alpha-glucan branching enzyme